MPEWEKDETSEFRKAEIIFMEHLWQQEALHLQVALVKYILSHAKNCVKITKKGNS